MSALARTTEIDCDTRAANEDCVNGGSRTRTKYGYDAANRLVSGLITGSTPQYAYGYDKASNLTSITPDGATQSFSYTSVNAITAGTYDANGSPLVLSGKTYKWDGANRIVRFTNSASNTGSSFTYDGLGRVVRVVDTHAGAITADHSYTWCGLVRCLAHDNTQSGSPISTQYFDQGAIISTTTYYYVRDCLGSATELVTSTGTIASEYTYDPYGNRTTVSGAVVADIGYAGYFYHAVSGLDFTVYRAYDPTHARWLNRDPIGESGGLNLYGYVAENPISMIDPLGLSGYGSGKGPLPHTPYPNGNYDSGFTKQDGVCTLPGAIGRWANSNPCVLKCCKAHDDCYTKNKCNASSWWGLGNVASAYQSCQKCNSTVVACISSAIGNGCSSCSK